MASIVGEVRGSALLRTRSMPIFEMTVGQGLDTVKCMWFHGSYLKDKFHAGQMIAIYGKLESSRSSVGKFKMIQPQFEILPGADSPEAEFVSLEVGTDRSGLRIFRWDDGLGSEADLALAAARGLVPAGGSERGRQPGHGDLASQDCWNACACREGSRLSDRSTFPRRERRSRS